MNYIRFFVSNYKILLFAILFTFFSGFGQTFLLSIYIPHFLSSFSISQTFYSSIYSGATILSGISLIFAGKIIDKISLKTFSLLVILGLTAANLFASITTTTISLFIALFLLRFFGQGLASHTALTAAGKYFQKGRGKALSIAYLGFPLTEGAMPSIILMTIAYFGWRQTFQLSAIAILLILLPFTLLFLQKFKPANINERAIIESKKKTVLRIDSENWSQKEVLKNRQFYRIAPLPFFVGFILTALFFFQTFIAKNKGWTIEWMALTIIAYAISSFAFSIISGPLTDRYTAKKLFPFILIPVVLGLMILNLSQNPIAALFYWFFVGITAGLNSTVSTALYAETYGSKTLGSVRSLFTFILISGTALGPLTYSILLDNNLTFNTINTIFSSIITIYCIIVFINSRKKTKIINHNSAIQIPN